MWLESLDEVGISPRECFIHNAALRSTFIWASQRGVGVASWTEKKNIALFLVFHVEKNFRMLNEHSYFSVQGETRLSLTSYYSMKVITFQMILRRLKSLQLKSMSFILTPQLPFRVTAEPQKIWSAIMSTNI